MVTYENMLENCDTCANQNSQKRLGEGPLGGEAPQQTPRSGSACKGTPPDVENIYKYSGTIRSDELMDALQVKNMFMLPAAILISIKKNLRDSQSIHF